MDRTKREQEAKIDRLKKEILQQAEAALAECKKTEDWKSFGLRMNGIYRSYAYASDPDYQIAMSEILRMPADKTATPDRREILAGNYGFRAMGCSQDRFEEDREALSALSKISPRAVETYTKGMNPCHMILMAEQGKAAEGIKETFETVERVATH